MTSSVRLATWNLFKKVQISKRYTTLSVIAESDIDCLFLPAHKLNKIPLYERPLLDKVYKEATDEYSKILYA